MGTLIFLLGFICLIPVCMIGVKILGYLGILGDLEDPAEWDVPEEVSEQNIPQIQVLEAEPDQRAV